MTGRDLIARLQEFPDECLDSQVAVEQTAGRDAPATGVAMSGPKPYGVLILVALS